MPDLEKSSAYLYEEAIMCSDAIAGGNGKIDPKFTSAFLFHAGREPDPEFKTTVDRLTPGVDRSNAPFKIGELTREQVVALYEELDPLGAIDRSQKDLAENGLDPRGVLGRNLKAIAAVVNFVLGKFEINGRSPMSIRDIREMAELKPLCGVDITDDLRTFKENLESALGRALGDDLNSLREAYAEVLKGWPPTSEGTRKDIQAELLTQGQHYARSVFQDMDLADTPLEVITWKNKGGYHIYRVDGTSLICLPDVAIGVPVPIDFFMQAHEGRTGHNLIAALAHESVKRGSATPHRLSGLMYTDSVALNEGWAQCHATSQVIGNADPAFFSTLGITPLDAKIFMDFICLRDAAQAEVSLLASQGLSTEAITAELVSRFPITPDLLGRLAVLGNNKPFSALYGPQYRDGRLVVSDAIENKKWGVTGTLQRISSNHDTISLREDLAA